MNKAVFFDKDGVLNVDKGISENFDETIELYQHVEDVIVKLRDKNYKIIVVTNQPVVARGILKEEKLKNLLNKFELLILERNNKAKIDKIYYCPHHPSANVEKYRIKCECRKPKPGMLIQAAEEFNIDLDKSYMIGDRTSDIIAGYLAGCKTVQCLTGKHKEKIIESDLNISEVVKPDYTINSLLELKGIIK